MDQFESALEYTLQNEGGFSDIPEDRGGATNFGITLADYAAFKKRPVTALEVRNMLPSEAAEIYRSRYWTTAYDKIPQAIATCLFDWGVLHGTHSARLCAQSAANLCGAKLEIDGVIGPKSVEAFNQVNVPAYVKQFVNLVRLTFENIVARNSTQEVFLKGWFRRADRMLTLIPAEVTTAFATPYAWAQHELAVGVKEVAGSKNNPRIVEYFKHTNYHATNDEVAWCSAFMCAAHDATGFKSTNSAAAKSWATYGTVGDGSVGDLAVFKRVGGNHIAFVNKPFKKGDKTINVLGGNQANRVCVQDMSAVNLLAIRRSVKA